MTDTVTPEPDPYEPECKRNIRAFLALWNAAPIQRTRPRDTISHQLSASPDGVRLTASDLARLLERDDYAEEARLQLAEASARHRARIDELEGELAQREDDVPARIAAETERDEARAIIQRVAAQMQDYAKHGSRSVNVRQVLNLLSPTWPDGNYESAENGTGR